MGIENHSIISDEQIFEILASSAYIMINKKLLERFGPDTSIFLANLLDKFKYHKENEQLEQGCYFYLLHDDQVQQTGLSEHKLRQCKKLLKDVNILETKRIGNKEYYKVQPGVIIGYITDENDDDLTSNISTSKILTSKNQTSDLENLDPNTNKNRDKEKKSVKEKFKNFNLYREIVLNNLPNSWIEDQALLDALDNWLIGRKEKKALPTQTACKLTGKDLSKYSLEVATLALETAAKNGWTGVFPHKIDLDSASHPSRKRNNRQEPDQTPKEIIMEKVNGSYASTFYGYFEAAQDLMPDLSDSEYLDLAQNMVTLRRYMIRKQTDTAKEHDTVPTPGSLVNYYTEWLSMQTWIDDLNPSLYTPDHALFAKFIRYISSNLNVHVLTGSTKTYSLTE
jgi:hypothetical protein